MAPKTTSAVPNGATPKGKGSKHTGSINGSTTQVPPAEKMDTSDATAAGGRPDKKIYEVEQEKIKIEIDSLQVKLSAVRDKISLATKSGSGNDKRTVLRAELDSIRGQQNSNKTSRGRILDQLKVINDGVQKKIKDLQTAKTKIPFKTVSEVDAHIHNLEKQVESGILKLADEKRTLQEISQTKRNRRLVEGFQADQEAIEADRQAADALRKQLDDPEWKAISERFDKIKAELDELKKEGDEAYAGRSKLFEERDGLQEQLDILFNQKRESAQHFREANDRYWTKVNEDRARRAERARAQRAVEEAEKRREIAERIREQAETPAFQAQIEDCQTLIDHFSGRSSGSVIFKSYPLFTKTDLVGVPKLELRQIEAGLDEGLVFRKKKVKGDDNDDDSSWFGGKKAKGKKGTTKSSVVEPDASSASNALNVPLPTLSALLALSIPPPTSTVDVPRLIEDLQTKKAWFEVNQARVTAENIVKADADIKRLTNGNTNTTMTLSPAGTLPPNERGERPSQSVSAPQVGDIVVTAVTSDKIVHEESLQEQADAIKAA